MRYSKIPSVFFSNNREKLLTKLKSNSLAVVTSNDQMPRTGDQHFPFRQNSDLFYLSGIEQEKCILCLYPEHPLETNREIIFTIRPDDNMETWEGHKLTKDEITCISGVKTVKYLDEFDNVFHDLIIRAENVYISLNENLRYLTDVPYRSLRFVNQLKKKYPLHNFERLAPHITGLRLIKEPEELAMIKYA